MSDLKGELRDTKSDLKETWRKADGEESLEDKAKNVGDRVGDAVDNAGDKVHEGVDDVSRDAAYDKGRADEMTRR